MTPWRQCRLRQATKYASGKTETIGKCEKTARDKHPENQVTLDVRRLPTEPKRAARQAAAQPRLLNGSEKAKTLVISQNDFLPPLYTEKIAEKCPVFGDFLR